MWQARLVWLILAVLMFSSGSADNPAERIPLPVEVLGADGTIASRSVVLRAEQSDSVRSLWLQTHGVHYATHASVQVNQSAWIRLNNDTVTVAEPGKSFGGIGGGFATLIMTVALPNGTVVEGANTIRFRFNETDGLSSGYRVLAWNFLTNDGAKVLSDEEFVEDAPESWKPPLEDSASPEAGKQLWEHAELLASSLPNSPRIQAHCADCHAQDGRDLKYFNFSNESIITRSVFHGLSRREGEEIASYIRSLRGPNPGRPWNPPYQPGPGLDAAPVSAWAAGAGLGWVLERDGDALPYLVSQRGTSKTRSEPNNTENVPALTELADRVNPGPFHPDANLSARDVPIALQLPDWSEWLPRIHPKDAWGKTFTDSEFANGYEGKGSAGKPSLPALLEMAQKPGGNVGGVTQGFAQWSRVRRNFLRDVVKEKAAWTPELSSKVYSTQLWQLTKTWELTQVYGLERRGRDLFGSMADSHTWCNTIPQETAPAEAHIPDGPAGIGGSALTNEYFNAAWYELQILLNAGNHQHRDRTPVDWVYVIGRFRDLFAQTHQAEPTRLLVAVTKSWQSSDPHLGPEDTRQGWRPEQSVDPRITISPEWAPMFAPLPNDVRRAVTTALLSAWMDKNLQYRIAKYLPLEGSRLKYTPSIAYGDISGGKAWEAAGKFREAGVPYEIVKRLELWGAAYTDRAARVQYK